MTKKIHRPLFVHKWIYSELTNVTAYKNEYIIAGYLYFNFSMNSDDIGNIILYNLKTNKSEQHFEAHTNSILIIYTFDELLIT